MCETKRNGGEALQIEPIEKDVPVAVCEACGEVIFKGDSAYLI